MSHFSKEQLKRINDDPALLSLLYDLDLLPEQVGAAIRHAREEERERCAKIAENVAAFSWRYPQKSPREVGGAIAQEIRAVAEQPKGKVSGQGNCSECGALVEHLYSLRCPACYDKLVAGMRCCECGSGRILQCSCKCHLPTPDDSEELAARERAASHCPRCGHSLTSCSCRGGRFFA